MAIICTCGHEVHSGNDTILVEHDDEDIDFDGPEPGFAPVTVMATYCPKCARTKGKRQGGCGSFANVVDVSNALRKNDA